MTVERNGSTVSVADKLTGDDRDVLRPGIMGPATLKYRVEDEMSKHPIKYRY